MFWSKNKKKSPDGMETTAQCQMNAEALYRSGKYHCAEAVMESIRVQFSPETPEAVVATVAGFGGGSGSGCICGAISGGTVALGLVLNDRKQTTDLTRELHAWFKDKYGVTCCKLIRKENDKGLCQVLTGEVAGKIAEMLDRQMIRLKDKD